MSPAQRQAEYRDAVAAGVQPVDAVQTAGAAQPSAPPAAPVAAPPVQPPAPIAPPPGTDVSSREQLQAMLADPRPAAEIEADLAAQHAAQEAAHNWRPTDDWQVVPSGAMQAAGQDATLQVRIDGENTMARLAPAAGTRESPVHVQTPADLDAVADRIDPAPTPGQKEAENYSMAHGKIHGLDVSIETPKGGTRTAKDGSWSVPNFPAHYGRFKGTKGADGDHVDFFYDGPNAFVIDQVDPDTHRFDEHKVVFANDEAHARAIYQAAFTDGRAGARLGAITPMPIEQLKAWLASGNTKKALTYRPLPPVKEVKAGQARGPLTALQYLASRGGLKPDGDLKALGLDRRSRVVVAGLGYRSVLRRDGMSLDDAHQALIEGGYLQPEPADRPNDIGRYNAIRDLIDEELRGRKSYAAGQELTGQDARAKRQNEIAEERLQETQAELRDLAQAQGYRATDEEMREAAELSLTSALDPHDALVHILERNALADENETAHTANVTESGDARQAQAAGASEIGAKPAQAIERARSQASATAGEAAPRLEHDEDQSRRGEARPADRPVAEPAGGPAAAEREPDRGVAQPTSDGIVDVTENGGMTFRTAKGSTYVVHEDGTTTRNKAARTDPGHEGDSGPKARSARTIYVDADKASGLSGAGLTEWGGKGYRLVLKDGHATLLSWNKQANQWGASEGSRNIPFTTTPEIGKSPVEAWKPADDVPGYEAYSGQHAGNAITGVGEVKHSGQVNESVNAETERGADNKPQLVLPGAEKVPNSVQAQRKADEKLKPKVAQKPAGGLFSDDSQQTDLVDMARKPAKGDVSANTDELISEGGPGKTGASAVSGGALEPLDRRIVDAYAKIRGDQGFNGRALLRDIRAELPDVPRAALDAALKRMQAKDIGVNLMQMDNRAEQTQADKDAALYIGKEPRHILWIERDPRAGTAKAVDASQAKAADPVAQPIERFPGEDGTEILIFKNSDGKRFNVVMRDTDAQQSVGPVKIVLTLERARAEAHKMLKGPQAVAPPEQESALPDKKTQETKAPETGPPDSGTAKPRASASEKVSKIADFGEKIGGARKDTAASTGERGKAKAEVEDQRPTWAKRYTIKAVEVKETNVATGEKTEGQEWQIWDDRTGKPIMDPAVRWKPMHFATKEQAEAMLPLAAVARKHRVVSKGADEFVIVRDVTEKKRVVIKDGFKARDEAMRYLHDHAIEILDTKTGHGEEILAAPKKAVRKGAEHRQGDATEKMFADTFGFRGVEFGNWNNQEERQEVMNHAFDGLMDLANLLNVPPKALSLDGDLAIAFGARGHGLSGARAHYERDYGVINLTKMSGAGSLAHEWMHALDHYLGRLDTKASSEKEKNSRGDMTFKASGSQTADYITGGASYKSQLRDELKAALKAVHATINYKAEKFVEDTAKAEKFLSAARAQIAVQLDAIRTDLTQKLPYGKRNVNPANAEQLSRFDAIADKIRNGEDLEVKRVYTQKPNARRGSLGVMRETTDTVESLSALYKEVRGRSGFDSQERRGPMDRVVARVQTLKSRLALMKDAEAQSEKVRNIPTSYARESHKMDEGRASDYWTEPYEMAARAFSAYVEDKIAEQGNASDFLSYGSDNAFYVALFNARPFPEGTERQAINESLDQLFSTFKLRDGKLGPDTALASMLSPQAASRVENAFAALTPKARQRRADLEAMLTRLVRRLAGPGVEVQFQPGERLTGAAAEKAAPGYGADLASKLPRAQYFPASRIIELALAGPNPRSNAFHEAWHDLEIHLLKDAEIALLKRETERLRSILQSHYGLTKQQAADLAGFEVRAYAFQAYVNAKEGGAPLHVGVRALFERIARVLRQIRTALSGHGFQTTEDIFEKALAGEFAGRPDLGRRSFESLSASIDPNSTAPQRQEATSIDPMPELIAARLEQRNLPKLARIARAVGLGRVNTVEARVKVQDKFLRWKNVQGAAERATRAPVPEGLNVYQAESLYYGRTGERLEKLDEKHIDPLVKDIKARGLKLEDVDQFLMARHAPERNAELRKINKDIADPSGMSDDKAKSILDKIDADGKRADYDAVEKRIRALIDETGKTLVEGGLISQATLDAWRKTYEHYVPLRGWAEGPHAEEAAGFGVGRGFDIRGQESKQALGRSSIADSPLGYVMLQAQQAIVRAEKNKVGLTALRFVQKNPDPELWQVDKGDPKRKVDPATGLVTETGDPTWIHRPNVFAVKIDGVPHYINFQGEYGENLARALKNLGTSNMPSVLRFIATLTRLQARLATSWNPDFMIPNFVRDVGEAFINMQEQDQKTFVTQFAKHLLPAVRGSFQALSGRGDGKYAQAFREFDQAGGRIRFFGLENVEDIKASVESKMRRLEGGALNNMRAAGEKAVGAIEIVNGSIENGTRLAAFMAARHVGLTPAKAASIAREMTVNFNRKGELGSAISALYMFANASMQGTTRMLSAMKSSKRVRRFAYGLGAAGAALALYNLGAGGDDDDGIPYYVKIPFWERDTNMIFMWPKGMGHDGQYIKIPLPYGYAFFHVIGARAMTLAQKKEPSSKAVPAMLAATLDAFDPLGRDANMIAQFLPSLARPAVHLYTNKSWTGRPISPEPTPWNKSEPNSTRHFRSASPFSIAAAQNINQLTGGTKHEPGRVDWSPGSIDHVLGFVTGGLGRFVMNTTSTAWGAYQGTEWHVEKTPILRRFAGEKNDQADRAIYFEEREKVKNAWRRMEAYRKEGDQGNLQRFGRENAAEISMHELFDVTDKWRAVILKNIDAIKADDNFSAVEKERRVKLKQKEELDLMAKARKRLYEKRE